MAFRFPTRLTASSRIRSVSRVLFLPAAVAVLASACSEGSTEPIQGQAGSAGANGGGPAATSGSGGTSSIAGAVGMAGTMSMGGSLGGSSAAGAGGGGASNGGAGGGGGASSGTAGQAGMGGAGGQAPVCAVPDTGGVDFAALANGPQDIEAEAAMLSGKATAAAFMGVDYVDFVGSSGSLLWLVDAPGSGKYTLNITYTADEARNLSLNVNCAVANASIPFGDTGSWKEAWISDVSQAVTLREGTNRIVLSTPGVSGPNIDKVSIEPQSCALSAGAPKPCEAEDALLSGSAAPATQGAVTYADMLGKEGALHWVLNAPAAGTYGVTFVYTQDDTRDMDLSVNGVKVATPLFNKTGSWTSGFVSDVTVQVELDAGYNGLALSTNGASGPNFDKITVESLGGGAGGGGAGGAGGALN